jgi:hypothetical protein
MQEHEADRDQKRGPLLIQGQEPHHHEEVKVKLDIAAGEMDEHGGGRDEPKGRHGGLDRPGTQRDGGPKRSRRDDPTFKKTVADTVIRVARKAGDADPVEPEHPQDAPVPLPPDPIG